MIRSKKTLWLCCFCTAVCIIVSSCGKKNDNRIVLTVWESSGGSESFIKKAGAQYSRIHPDIVIKYVNVETPDAAVQIALDGPAGLGPDLFAASHDKIGELVVGGHICPLTVATGKVEDGNILVNDDPFADVIDVCKKALCRNNVWMGFPVSAETYALFYNRELLNGEPIPQTWDDLVDFARRFNKNNRNKYGFMMDVGNPYYSALFTTMRGNRIFASGADTAHTYLDTPEAACGMHFFRSLRQILPVPAIDITTSVCDGAFASGKCALYVTGLWNLLPFSDAGISFGTAPLPSLPGETTPACSFSGIRTMFVSAYSKHLQIAADFGAFLMTPEMQQLRFTCTGAVPAIAIDVESLYVPAFQTQLKYSFPMPSIPQIGSFWDAMHNACCNIWDGADVSKELTVCNNVILGN